MADIHFVRQHEPRGLGHAVGMARHHVGDEPFAVLLPDDLMAEDSTVLADMVAAHERTGARCWRSSASGPRRSRPTAPSSPPDPSTSTGWCRSPAWWRSRPGEAPSDLAIMGRYVLSPRIFDCIERLEPGAGGELQLTDAMRMLVASGGEFFGLPFETGRYDTGNKLDWLRATVEVALQHPEVGKGFREALTDIVRREGIR